MLGRTARKVNRNAEGNKETGYCSFSYSLLQDGDVGIGVSPEGEESSGGLRYCGSPTFRTSSANRGSERMGSSGKSAFKPTSSRSCS
jgi:hypothetical protein